MNNLSAEIAAYATSLQDFFDTNELPREWFAQPDHVAYKCVDSAEFEAALWVAKGISQQLSYIHMNSRRLAAVHLAEPCVVGEFGMVDWLELMEPRPERIGRDVVGLEHMEFYYPDFAAVQRVLEEKGIEYRLEENPSHAWVNIIINSHGQELKLNNGLLANVVAQEIADKSAIIV